jgi:hypothetical protein
MIILIVAGAVPLVVCIIKMKMLNAFKKKSVVTNATVTKVEERHHYKIGIIYRATVEYKTGKEELYLVTVPLFKKHIIGDTVRLMYMPDDPTKFSTDFGKRLPFFLLFTVVLFMLIAWLCTWLHNLEFTVQ